MLRQSEDVKAMPAGVEFMQMVLQEMNDAIKKGHAKDELPAIFEVLCDRNQ